MMGAMFTSYSVVNSTYRQVADRAKISQAGRDIVGMIVRDIRMAGYKYFGEHIKGKADGKGTFIYSNGSKYTGLHKNDVAYGQGTMTWANGDKYIGEHKNDKGNGDGVYQWANGDKYIGEHKDDKPHGKGLFTFANGSVLKGCLLYTSPSPRD